MAFNRPQAEVEFGGNLFITQPPRHCLGDAPLGVCQFFIADRLLHGFSFTKEARNLGVHTFHPLENVGDDGHQFVRLERFRQIGIHSGTESGDAVGGLVLGCQKDDRDELGARGGPQVPD